MNDGWIDPCKKIGWVDYRGNHYWVWLEIDDHNETETCVISQTEYGENLYRDLLTYSIQKIEELGRELPNQPTEADRLREEEFELKRMDIE